MKTPIIAGLAISHTLILFLGFALGIYFLPILTAPESPSAEAVQQVSSAAKFSGAFKRELEGSDAFHWAEGTVSVSAQALAFEGEMSPGPDYKLYLSPVYVETEAAFEEAREQMVRIGEVKTFDGFVVPIPEGVDPSDYQVAIVWCESFGEFISATRYQ